MAIFGDSFKFEWKSNPVKLKPNPKEDLFGIFSRVFIETTPPMWFPYCA